MAELWEPYSIRSTPAASFAEVATGILRRRSANTLGYNRDNYLR